MLDVIAGVVPIRFRIEDAVLIRRAGAFTRVSSDQCGLFGISALAALYAGIALLATWPFRRRSAPEDSPSR
jgi:hypothetical protein